MFHVSPEPRADLLEGDDARGLVVEDAQHERPQRVRLQLEVLLGYTGCAGLSVAHAQREIAEVLLEKPEVVVLLPVPSREHPLRNRIGTEPAGRGEVPVGASHGLPKAGVAGLALRPDGSVVLAEEVEQQQRVGRSDGGGPQKMAHQPSQEAEDQIPDPPVVVP